MKLNFEFDSFEPPVLQEQDLREILEKRQLIKRALMLTLASALIHICLALLALYLSFHSLPAALVCLVFLGISLLNSGIAAVLFTRKMMNVIPY